MTPRTSRLVVLGAAAVHVALLASLVLGQAVDHPNGQKHSPPASDPSDFHRLGYLNDLFNDAAPYMYGQGADFFIVLSAGRMMREGRSMYDLRPHRSVPYAYIPYPYFPTMAWLFSRVFAGMSAWQAYWSWVALDELLMLANLWLCGRLARGRQPGTHALLAAMWLAYFPHYVELFMGQMNYLMTTCLHAFLVAAVERRAIAMALAWTAGFLAKMLPVLLLPALLRFRRLGVLAAGLLLAAIPLLPFALAPGRAHDAPWPWPLSALHLAPIPVPEGIHQILSHLDSAAVPGPYAGSPSFGGLLRVLVPSQTIQRGIRMGALLLALVVLVRSRDLALASGLLLSSYFLAYSHPWEHHFVIALPALGLLAAQGGGFRLGAFVAWVPMAAPTAYVAWGDRFIESPWYFLPKAVASMVLFGLYVAINLRQPSRPA